MKIAVLTIGNELLKGSIANTNLAAIGQELLSKGLFISSEICVNDTREDILEALKFLSAPKADVVIVTGGLGPTTDDITVETVAGFFGLKLHCDEKIVLHIEKYLSKVMPGKLSKQNRKQAFVPVGSRVLWNWNGTAPGVFIAEKSMKVFLLPGPPSEMYPMLKEYVIPEVLKGVTDKFFIEQLFTVGVPESELQRIVSEEIGSPEGIYIAYRATFGMCELSFSGKNKAAVKKHSDKMRSILGGNVLAKGFKDIAEELVYVLGRNKLRLAVAESCTGGLIASKITDVPGASKCFVGGIVAYSNELKESLLGVCRPTLDKFGAVSLECAVEMVDGLCHKLKTDAGIAVTGIAGPDGGTPGKPVGTVCIAAKLGDMISFNKFSLNGNRERIRQRAVAYALNMLRSMLPG